MTRTNAPAPTSGCPQISASRGRRAPGEAGRGLAPDMFTGPRPVGRRTVAEVGKGAAQLALIVRLGEGQQQWFQGAELQVVFGDPGGSDGARRADRLRERQ